MYNHNGEEIKSLDYLALFVSFIGVLNYSENLKQTSNDELMEELKAQTKDFLETITEQNKIILEKINEIEKRL